MVKKIKKIILHALGIRGVVGYHGWVEIRDPKTGALLQVIDNIVVNGGLAQAALLLGDGAAQPLTLSCVGTNNTAAQATDANLGTQVDSQAPTFSRVQTAVANDTAQFVSLHTAGAGGWALTEFGMKTAAGTLFNRVVFAVINLAEGNQLEFTYKCQVTAVA